MRFITIAVAGAMLSLPVTVARAQSDEAMSCEQLTAAVNVQNDKIKSAEEDKQALASRSGSPGDADPAIKQRLDEIASDKATARAKTLVALGRQKKCFR
jgi:hypothetical protein